MKIVPPVTDNPVRADPPAELTQYPRFGADRRSRGGFPGHMAKDHDAGRLVTTEVRLKLAEMASSDQKRDQKIWTKLQVLGYWQSLHNSFGFLLL
jgi:hypothetical protein